MTIFAYCQYCDKSQVLQLLVCYCRLKKERRSSEKKVHEIITMMLKQKGALFVQCIIALIGTIFMCLMFSCTCRTNISVYNVFLHSYGIICMCYLYHVFFHFYETIFVYNFFLHSKGTIFMRYLCNVFLHSYGTIFMCYWFNLFLHS